MKRAFTLVELLIVIMVMAILMTLVFRLSSVGESAEARAKTVMRMQRLENCLSGYYAAFGSYPPVKMHGSPNIYYKVNGSGIQQVTQDPDGSEVVWNRVEAACRCQPMGMNYPYADGLFEYVKTVSQALMELHNAGQEGYKDNPQLARLFDALENPAGLGSEKQNSADWTVTQVFRFGLMSYLLPRYLLMMRHTHSSFGNTNEKNLSLYDDFAQWSDNNQMPCRFEDGTPYSSWQSLAGETRWKVALLPSQSVTARWMPNLEGILSCEVNPGPIYGVNIESGDAFKNVMIGNPYPTLYSAEDSQSGEGGGGGQLYALDGITCYDGWGNEFYYHSPAPYQSYRLWSAGENKRTFPPWISDEEISKLNGTDRTMVLNWLSDDIVKMKN